MKKLALILALALAPLALVLPAASGVAAEATPDGEAFKQFENEVKKLNDQTIKLVGKKLYWSASNPEKGVASLMVTDTWLLFKKDEREANLRYLVFLWGVLHPDGTPITVRLTDGRGTPIMELNKK